MKRKLILMITLLVLSGCGPSNESDGYTAIDQITCGTLVKTCDHTEYIIIEGVKDLSQNVGDHTRYYRYWDCALEQWHESTCKATCTLKIR